MAKRLEQTWVVIDKRWNHDRYRFHHQIDAVFGNKQAAHDHLENIEASDYDRTFRDVVVVPFEVLNQPPRWRDLWRIEHQSDSLRGLIVEPIRVFEHDEPRWFRSDLRLPAVEIDAPPHDNFVCVTGATEEQCLETFKEVAAEHDIEYYKPPLRMPGALPPEYRQGAGAADADAGQRGRPE